MGAIVLFAAYSLTAATSFARKNTSDLERKVHQTFAAYDKSNSPGCSVGVGRDGEFVY